MSLTAQNEVFINPSSCYGNFHYIRHGLTAKSEQAVQGNYRITVFDSHFDTKALQEMLYEGTQGIKKKAEEIVKGSRSKSKVSIGAHQYVIFWGAPAAQKKELLKTNYLGRVLKNITEKDILNYLESITSPNFKTLVEKLTSINFAGRLRIRIPTAQALIEIDEGASCSFYYPLYEFVHGTDLNDAEQLVTDFFKGELTFAEFEDTLFLVEQYLENEHGIKQTDRLNPNIFISLQGNTLELVLMDVESITLQGHPEMEQDAIEDRKTAQ